MTKWFVFTILFLSIFLSCSSSRKGESSPGKDFAFDDYYAALAEIDAGNFQSALSKLNTAIRKKPEFVRFYFVKGQIFDFLNQPDSALAAYLKSLQLKSYYPQVWIRLAALYSARQQFSQAAVYYNKAVEALPDSIQLKFKLANAYLRLKRPQLARDVLLTYRRTHSRPLPDFHKWYGLTLFGLKNYTSAENHLRIYLKLTGGDFESQKILGLTEFHLGEYDQAISSLNLALGYNRKDPEIYFYRAKYFLKRQKKAVAFEQLQRGLALDSLNKDILLEMGKLQYEGGYWLSAKTYLKKVLSQDAQNWAAYRYLGLIAEKEKDWQAALNNYNLYLKNILFEDKEIQNRVAALRKKLSQE